MRKERKKALVKVAAAVIEKDGRILLARRKKEKKDGGRLEFPGGKVLPGEEPHDGLRRELEEEFGLKAEIGECLGIFKNSELQPEIELWVFRVSVETPPSFLSDHEEILWVRPEEAPLPELLPLDRLIVHFLRSSK